ncbi:HAD family hydrolase [Actinoplanes sp. N902-109]|uniref:HAD-IIIC family phosphatase n=1 Tax=Actinoplanes sp. (strain N902-109) TaxID=649831 RepID=UPI0003295D21|nr:HAD-IIIC family phosphatase [Actinoplanes sp. N902-109]AGL14993.1 hypothetical protein L083_1483 [Actinoplanes sp. N902-109]
MADLVKCVVWDLDETLWEGTLVEGDPVTVPQRNRELVRTLDEHGILQSVASRNDAEPALAALHDTGLAEYFLHPQVGWAAKSGSVRAVAEALAIGLDALLFVDDSDFERAEVRAELPQVRCVRPDELHELARTGRLLPATVTGDAAQRRAMYQSEQRRKAYETSFAGPSEEFLRSLGMKLEVRAAEPADLSRAAELTQRTHQLNTTGITFDERELAALLDDPGHRVLVAGLTDTFGTYGTIGLLVVRVTEPLWTIRLLLMSCRVMGRNIGTAVVGAVAGLARAAGADLAADFRATDRNRQMRLTYRLLGFEAGGDPSPDGLTVFRLPPSVAIPIPSYVDLHVHDRQKQEQN